MKITIRNFIQSLGVKILLVLICTSIPAAVFCQQNNTRKLILRDEGLSQLSFADLGKPQNSWQVQVPAGRDIQLIGKGLVLIGTGTGYEEREISTGKKINELNTFPGTIAAQRLRNGNTLLTGVNWQGKQGIVLAEVDKAGKVVRLITYPGTYARLVRQTPAGTFLVTADDTVFEGTDSGAVLWQAKITGFDKQPHVWQALRLANGQTVASGGYAKSLQIFGTDGKQVKTITGPAEVNPVFYSGFQILNNGNYVVTNWQGHGPNFGASGVQLLEYNPDGKLVWSWKQDAAKFSSLQAVIVLDGLDVNLLHTENTNGVLAPVK